MTLAQVGPISPLDAAHCPFPDFQALAAKGAVWRCACALSNWATSLANDFRWLDIPVFYPVIKKRKRVSNRWRIYDVGVLDGYVFFIDHPLVHANWDLLKRKSWSVL